MEATKQIEQLLEERTGREPVRKPLIQYLLSEGFGMDVEPEYGVKTGSVDLYLPARRVVIEVKDSVKLHNPHRKSTGASPRESAYEQVCRYVRDERERERNHNSVTPNYNEVKWLGAVTDGIVWWMWEWQHTSDDPSPLTEYQPFNANNPDALRRVVNSFDRLAGKRWAPSDPTELFRPDLETLKEQYRAVSGLESTRTQLALWFKQLELSGSAPIESERVELFTIHTLLIAVARTIAETVGGQLPDRKGFVAWSNDGVLGEAW